MTLKSRLQNLEVLAAKRADRPRADEEDEGAPGPAGKRAAVNRILREMGPRAATIMITGLIKEGSPCPPFWNAVGQGADNS